MKIVIVIPAYNEASRISETLNMYIGKVIKKYGDSVSIIISSDSTDRTDKIVSAYSAKHRQIKLLKLSRRKGKGGAVLEGFRVACREGADIVGFMDADSSVPGREIIRLIEKIRGSGRIDCAIATRYSNKSRIIGRMRLSRFIASRIFNFVVRLEFGFKYGDTQCGAKFFRGKALCSILDKILLLDMSFDVNLLYELKLAGYNTVEVPITYKIINEGSKIVVYRDLPKLTMIATGYRVVRSRIGKFINPRIRHSVYELLRKM